MKGKIFNAQEVQAIIAGNKTQFREVVKPQPKKGNAFLFDDENRIVFQKDCCPYRVGQKIFCKESFWEAGGNIIYRADYESYKPISTWRRAMKQEHSRLTLLIKEITVERLQDISEEDAIAEGINPNTTTNINNYFRNLWNCTHKKPEEKFEANPWVWVVNFEELWIL